MMSVNLFRNLFISTGADGDTCGQDIEVNGDFLEAGKHVVTEEDFIGSTCEINYVIRQEKLGKGNQYGEIIVKTPYQKLVYHVLASRGTESA